MLSFHARRINPAALSLVIVGDVPVSHAVERAARELDDWKRETHEQVDVPSAPEARCRREHVIPMPGKSQTDIAYGFTTVRRLDPRFYAYWMMNNVLGQFGLGGRLADNIRERQGMAYYAFSSLDALAGEAPLVIRAGVDPANVGRTVAAIDHEVATLGTGGPHPDEVEQSRGYLVGSIPRMLETNQSIAAFLQTSEEFGLGPDFDRRLPAFLRAVTVDQVRAAAAEVLSPERAAVAIAGPPEGRG
jgi:zinc protease